MKKKILSLIMICCLVLPCFFSVACKGKEEADKQKPYTYSIVLKNAKAKLDADLLPTEYDYAKGEDVGFSLDGNDYKLTVTKSIPLDGELKINLLESIDYSSLGFKVNDKAEDYDVKSGDVNGVAGNVNLYDRYFIYSYKKMQEDTSIVVDFSDCATAKISLDVSDLKSNNVKYYIVEDEFVTLSEAKLLSGSYKLFEDSEIQVEYGTIFAFDYSEQLAFRNSNDSILKKLQYSIFGSKFLVAGNGRVQYFTVKHDGKYEIYSLANDPEQNETLRSLFTSGVKYATSLENLKNREYITPEKSQENFENLTIPLTISAGEKFYVELDSDGQLYNYYLVDSINENLSSAGSKLLEQKELSGTSEKYLEIDLTGKSVKYLVRRPRTKMTADYYFVYFSENSNYAIVNNADFVLVGKTNVQTLNIEEAGIVYGFKKDKDVELSLSLVSNYENSTFAMVENTNFGMLNKSASISVLNKNDSEIISEERNPAVSTELTLECLNNDISSGTNLSYAISISYEVDQFVETEMKLSQEHINLYSGEKVYYTTNIADLDSWKELTSSDNLTISPAEGRTIYYYFESSRNDATLQIKNESGDYIGITGNLLDCFGRKLTGTVGINGTIIDLSKINYIEIEPDVYDSTHVLQLVRNYDRQYHNISLSALSETDNIMISFNGYLTDSFMDIRDIHNLKIRTEYSLENTIYYYVNSALNKYVVLKDNNGDVVSSTELIYEGNSPLQINGLFVYSLTLNPNYYNDEEFVLTVQEACYKLVDENGDVITLFSDDFQSSSTTEMFDGKNYYFAIVEQKNYDVGDPSSLDIDTESANYAIKDKNGTVVVASGSIHFHTTHTDEDRQTVTYWYWFKFTLADYSLYVPNTEFMLEKI